MIFKRKETKPGDFWREYEEKTGEKILSHGLGQYLSGWREFEERGWTEIWGLIMSTSGGFRFHHFPQRNWIEALAGNSETPKEKTIFIPGEKIISANLVEETRWWKKLLSHSPPRLVIRYRDEAENERALLIEAELNSSGLIGSFAYDSAATAAPKSDACSTGEIT